MRISVISPVLNEAPWIGYSILACLPYMHEFIYAVDSHSSDGTWDILKDVKAKEAHEKLIFFEHPHYSTDDTVAYNRSYQACLDKATGDAIMFLHPDMVITNPEVIPDIDPDALAWYVNLTSYVGDLETVFKTGRCSQWKNIHANKFGLHYAGKYGSQNEDFYHRDITGSAHHFHGFEFKYYPYIVKDSKIKANHYCEVKSYERRLEKMIKCLKTQCPRASHDQIVEFALSHPRVTLKPDPRWDSVWGDFEIMKSPDPVPDVIRKNKARFESFTKQLVEA